MYEGTYRRRQRGDSHILAPFITLGWPSSRRPCPIHSPHTLTLLSSWGTTALKPLVFLFLFILRLAKPHACQVLKVAFWSAWFPLSLLRKHVQVSGGLSLLYASASSGRQRALRLYLAAILLIRGSLEVSISRLVLENVSKK